MTSSCAAETGIFRESRINTLRPRQNGRHFPDDIFKCIFVNENVWISLKISLKFVPKVPINNIPALVLIMAWRRPGDKPLSEPMIVSWPTHICVTRQQWVKAMAADATALSVTGQQQQCYWLCAVWIFLPVCYWNFIYPRHLSVEKWWKMLWRNDGKCCREMMDHAVEKLWKMLSISDGNAVEKLWKCCR